MAGETLTMLAVGDNLLYMKKPEVMFALVAPILKSADIVVGQLETPCTARPATTPLWGWGMGTKPPSGYALKRLDALRSAGFNVIHLAGNKIWDAGAPGIEDTITGLRNLGIATVGAGMNLDEARTPAVIKRKGTRVGFLSYNCVGPREAWANPLKPGCAWIRILTTYELDHPTPGANPTIYTFAELESVKAMSDDIHKLRPKCDVLVVHFHKGIGMTHIRLATYEQQVSYAAIEAGADLILAEHAHTLRGIELYRGKAIFHGLGQFVPFDPDAKPAPASPWLVHRQQKLFMDLFGQELDESETWPVAPNSMMTIIAKCILKNGKISRVGFLPCLINKRGQPEILKHDARGQKVFDYMEKITGAIGLNAKYRWKDDEVIVSCLK
jgi:poly-gamma-glutamate capsule biosynthesis protein CapA/YwtB (metallophosphatase superfamily)